MKSKLRQDEIETRHENKQSSKKQQKTGEEPFKLSCGAGRYERGETL
jgi:hypothetical protein